MCVFLIIIITYLILILLSVTDIKQQMHVSDCVGVSSISLFLSKWSNDDIPISSHLHITHTQCFSIAARAITDTKQSPLYIVITANQPWPTYNFAPTLNPLLGCV